MRVCLVDNHLLFIYFVTKDKDFNKYMILWVNKILLGYIFNNISSCNVDLYTSKC